MTDTDQAEAPAPEHQTFTPSPLEQGALARLFQDARSHEKKAAWHEAQAAASRDLAGAARRSACCAARGALERAGTPACEWLSVNADGTVAYAPESEPEAEPEPEPEEASFDPDDDLDPDEPDFPDWPAVGDSALASGFDLPDDHED